MKRLAPFSQLRKGIQMAPKKVRKPKRGKKLGTTKKLEKTKTLAVDNYLWFPSPR